MGYSWIYSFLFAVFVYAGSAQYMTLSLINSNTSFIDLVLLTLLINFRHIFYGPSIFGKLKGGILNNFHLIFGLTDETYSIITSDKSKETNESQFTENDFKMIGYLNHAYWIAGCTLGGISGAYLNYNIEGLEFVLTALFTVLAYEQFKAKPSLKLIFISLSFGLFSFYLLPQVAILCALCQCFIFLILSHQMGGIHAK